MSLQSVAAYPLAWPRGVPRTKTPMRSRFGKGSWEDALKLLHRELRALGATNVTLSTNLHLRNDGHPYAQQKLLSDSGVAVYFTLNKAQVCFPCDRWKTIAENIRAVTLHIQSMRGQERWGVGTASQAFAGYKALPAVAGQDEDWWVVLGLEENTSEEKINETFRKLSLKFHPDFGGTQDQMSRINRARTNGLAAVRNSV